MAYTILNNDGTLLVRVADDSIDQSTSVTFIGRDYPGYGQYYNQNLVTLLTNSASVNYNPPGNPQQGQLWYDTTFNRLKVFDGTSFVTAGGAVVSKAQPSGLFSGDFWYDSVNKTLNFFNGAGYDSIYSYPINSVTGWVLPNPLVLDNNTPGVPQQVTLIENYNNVIGLLSESTFVASTNDSSSPSRLSNAGSSAYQVYQGLNILGNISSTASIYSNFLSVTYDVDVGRNLTINGTFIAQNLLATNATINQHFVSLGYTDLVNLTVVGPSNLQAVTATNLTVNGPSTLQSVTATSLWVAGISTITGILYAGSDVYVTGNLYVDGTQTVINKTNVASGDATITLSSGSNTALAAANAGLQIGSTASPYISWLYDGVANWKTTGGISVTGQSTLNALAATLTTVTQLTVSGNETISGTLGVTGQSTLNALAATLTTVTQLTVSGNETMSGTLGVTGQSTLNALAATLTTVTQLTVSGQTLISNATMSMSTNTGALVITGGVGIGGALYVGSTATHYGHILPAQSNTYNLGSPTQQWGALYVNTQTIYMGGIAVTVINTGSTATLTVGGSQVITTATVANYTAARSLAYAIAFG
jgi:hypothetical protein